MADWQLINVTFTSAYLSIQGWKAIADLIGGEVKSASEWGFTSITGLWSTTPSLETLAVYVPNNSNYGLIDYGGSSYGSPDTTIYIVPMTGGDVTVLASVGGGLDTNNTTARVYVGDGFSVIAPLEGLSYYRVCGFDTVHDVIGDRDFSALVSFGQGVSSASIFDLEEGDSLYSATGSELITGLNITQNDGSLYTELIQIIARVMDKENTSLTASIYICEHFYRRFYNYATREKNILVNGIKFTTPLGSEIYFATE